MFVTDQHTIEGKGNSSNSYVFGGEPCIVVDTGVGETTQELIKHLKGRNPKKILVVFTHCHYDHCGGASELRGEFGKRVTFAAHEADADAIEKADERTLAHLFGEKMKPVPIKIRLKEGDVMENTQPEVPVETRIPFSFKVLHTPGHTKGSITLHDVNYLVSGDSIEEYAQGHPEHVDKYTGNFKEYTKSSIRIKELLERQIKEIKHRPEWLQGHVYYRWRL